MKQRYTNVHYNNQLQVVVSM